jgi:cytochrome c oxidase subunit 3
MSVILVFIVVTLGLALWWLSQQRLMAKPWLETGTAAGAGGYDDTGLPTAKIALIVFLAVVGSLFALFASAYIMRTEYSDWRSVPLPQIVWLNTVMLVLGSIALQAAATAARGGDIGTVRVGLVTAGVASVAFMAGQIVAWRDLIDSGYFLAENPANAFFDLITGLHGLHILGGLVALGRVMPGVWEAGHVTPKMRLAVELCATYWHFLLIVWLGVLVLLVGWVNEFINICRQLLT